LKNKNVLRFKVVLIYCVLWFYHVESSFEMSQLTTFTFILPAKSELVLRRSSTFVGKKLFIYICVTFLMKLKSHPP